MRISCVACGESAAQRDLFYYEWRDRVWSIYRCRACTHQFVYPSVTDEEQSVIYGDQYFSATGDWSAGHFAGYEDAEADLRAEARQVLAMLPVRSGRLLDIGCAGGIFLDEARRAGFSVAGIEYNAQMADRARSLDLDVRQGAIESIPLDAFGAEFDVVTMMDVLEHLPQPRAAIERVGRWSTPQSVLFLRGPLLHSRLARLKETARRLLNRPKRLEGYPLDANMWNRRSLAALLASDGFTVSRWINATSMFANVVATR